MRITGRCCVCFFCQLESTVCVCAGLCEQAKFKCVYRSVFASANVLLARNANEKNRASLLA